LTKLRKQKQQPKRIIDSVRFDTETTVNKYYNQTKDNLKDLKKLTNSVLSNQNDLLNSNQYLANDVQNLSDSMVRQHNDLKKSLIDSKTVQTMLQSEQTNLKSQLLEMLTYNFTKQSESFNKSLELIFGQLQSQVSNFEKNLVDSNKKSLQRYSPENFKSQMLDLLTYNLTNQSESWNRTLEKVFGQIQSQLGEIEKNLIDSVQLSSQQRHAHLKFLETSNRAHLNEIIKSIGDLVDVFESENNQTTPDLTKLKRFVRKHKIREFQQGFYDYNYNEFEAKNKLDFYTNDTDSKPQTEILKPKNTSFPSPLPRVSSNQAIHHLDNFTTPKSLRLSVSLPPEVQAEHQYYSSSTP